MSSRFTRADGNADPTNYSPIRTVNHTIYATDSADVPPTAISSESVDNDLNYIIDSLNALDDDINAVVAGGLPTQTGNSGKFLTTNGTTASWAAVTSAALSGSNSILLGTDASGSGDEISLSSELTLSGSTLSVTAGGIGTTEIADDSVTLGKMASGTAGNLITYDASGDPAAVSTGTSGQLLTSNGAGAAPTFQTLSVPDFAAVESTLTGTASLQTDSTGTEGTPNWAAITGMSDSITTQTTGNKVLVTGMCPVMADSGSSVMFRLKRGSTVIYAGRAALHNDASTNNASGGNINFTFVDSPGTAGSYTYSVEFSRGGAPDGSGGYSIAPNDSAHIPAVTSGASNQRYIALVEIPQ